MNQIERELNRVIDRAFPDTVLREKVLAIYRQNPLLNQLLEEAGAHLPDIPVPRVQPPHGSDAFRRKLERRAAKLSKLRGMGPT